MSIRGELGDLRDIVRARGWSFPVGWDRDGVLASIYGVATCPHAVVADWRGRVRATLAGSLTEGQLERAVQGALGASRRAGWRP